MFWLLYLKPLITSFWAPLLGDSHKASCETSGKSAKPQRVGYGPLLGWGEGLVSGLVRAQVFTAVKRNAAVRARPTIRKK